MNAEDLDRMKQSAEEEIKKTPPEHLEKISAIAEGLTAVTAKTSNFLKNVKESDMPEKLKEMMITSVIYSQVMLVSDNIDEAMALLEQVKKSVIATDKDINQK